MNKLSDNELLLQKEWLKNNKPNSYFETLTDKRKDALIGLSFFIKVDTNNKKISRKKVTIIKRRSIKNEDFQIEHRYFDDLDNVYTQSEILSLCKKI
ncbi:hypothetical protein CP985_03295 [Malaciobacter mytili LMG 24559]|uniref:Uncharacterized protein n=1 Tax=Malaciobacter mytili LMG 24559 TaxID=1032238 RepID=A0AAX2AHG7_9BACT|nr:hypothetical protein [Malaciobacter mytili]AXH16383.1 hypothetical protein AMYT_a0084 [Malaciobacter mytili LMG 24559]RXK16449.1 hypothetical protein CP985_03295 [Malaciobacter mytili LMG 24559]